MSTPTTTKSTTVASEAAADRWLDRLEREGWVVTSASMSQTDGNKVKVTAAVTRQPVAVVEPTQPGPPPAEAAQISVTPQPDPVTETKTAVMVCKAPGCENTLPAKVGRGRVKEFCSDKCRQAAHRQQRRTATPTAAPAATVATTNLRADVAAALQTLTDRLGTITDDEVNQLDPATLPQVLKHATALTRSFPAKAQPTPVPAPEPVPAARQNLPRFS